MTEFEALRAVSNQRTRSTFSQPNQRKLTMRQAIFNTAAILGVCLASMEPASAELAFGSLGFAAVGEVKPNTGVLNPATSSLIYEDGGVVTQASTGNLGIAQGTFVEPTTFIYAPGLSSGSANVNLEITDHKWHFDWVEMDFRAIGNIAATFRGNYTGGSGLDPSSGWFLTQSCDQKVGNGSTGPISCSNTVLGRIQQIPEPGSLGILGGALLALGLLLRRRQTI